MKHGVIKWFNEAKQFGFITSEGVDYFVHLQGVKEKIVPIAGQDVKFTPKAGSKGVQASDVEIIEFNGNK
jgi:cold shock protein